MITFQDITTLSELEEYMPLFYEGYVAMSTKHKAFELDWDGFVKTMVGVINTVPKNGITVVLMDGVAVGYGVGFDDTPAYSLKQIMLLWALYVKPGYSKIVAPELCKYAFEYAKQQGYDEVKAFNNRFSGASFRFFEQLLGMHRSNVVFSKKL
jgi:hypothetical protein